MNAELMFEIQHAKTEEEIDALLDILYSEVERIEWAVVELLERSRKLES